MIDALCHLELHASVDDASRALDDAAARGVEMWISAGTDPLADERVPPSPRVRQTFGIHPERLGDVDAQLRALEVKLDGAVALGECGVDARFPDLDAQERAFRAQVAVAKRRGLPVIVHGVRAPRRVLDVMGGAGVRWVWHAFTDSADVAREAVASGAVISVGFRVLHEKTRKLRDVVARLALADLVVETDAPHVPLSALADIVAGVAALRGEPADAVAAATARTARAIYGL